MKSAFHDHRWIFIVLATIIGVLTALSAARFLTSRESVEFPVGSVGDYQHYHYAAAAIMRGENPYQQHTRFYGYLPFWALVNVPLVPLGPAWAGAIYSLMNGIVVFVSMFLWSREAIRRLGGVLRHEGESVESLVARFHGPVMLCTTLCMLDKIRAVLRLGQTDAIILLALFFAFKLVDRRVWLAGFFLGVVAQFKFQSLAMIPYFVVRRMWGPLMWTLTWTCALAVSGALFWGWEKNNEYLKIALGSLMKLFGSQPIVADGPRLYPLTWERSISIPSIAARFSESAGFNGGTVVVGMVGAILLICVGWAFRSYSTQGLSLFSARHPDIHAKPSMLLIEFVEWCGLIVGALAFSPQTTTRHMLITIPLVAFGLGVVMMRRRITQRGSVLLIGSGLMLFTVGLLISSIQYWGLTTAALFLLFFAALGLSLRIGAEKSLTLTISSSRH